MNDMYVWGGLALAILIFGWLVWPKDEKPAQLDPVKSEPPAPEPVKEETPVAAKTTKKTTAPKKTPPVKKSPPLRKRLLQRRLLQLRRLRESNGRTRRITQEGSRFLVCVLS